MEIRCLKVNDLAIRRQRFCFKRFVVAVIISCCLTFLSKRALFQQLETLDSTEFRKFIFMKTHKCGTSTIENIIFRFALKNELNIVLPEEGSYLSRTELFDHNSLNDTKWKDLNFDIFALHNRWNKKEVLELLREDVPAFTVIREPVEVFESLFHYLDPQLKNFYGVQDIHDMIRAIRNATLSDVVEKRWLGSIGRNQIAWDLGISPDIFDNENAITEEIQRLDHEFHLVMIANRMDESLILMKQLLNWPLQNVVHLDLNRRKPEKSSKLSVAERKVLEKWLAADVQIFQYFSRRFDEKVAEFNWKYSTLPTGLSDVDSAIKRQTQLLEEANKQLYDRCVLSEVGNEELVSKYKTYNDNIMGYSINEEQEDCALYVMSERSFLSTFRDLLLSKLTTPSSLLTWFGSLK
ncbi:galactosylceramide sulfotransferase-like [Daphnia carinata]|uniref:galactosylceramide sulfotransferase-like n=1 Tax=Daphnia carinata TaxID=120202 RepID=UPI00257A2A27|nr:galactosylceramide sulfotransferase-like [Daphnia carinata]